jgi:undecaprenyl-diphosphatase
MIDDLLSLDRSLLFDLNSWAHRSTLLDKVVVVLLGQPLLEGSFFCLFLWWLWFAKSDSLHASRISATRAVAGLYIALFAARALQTFSPRRIRPVNDPELQLVAPFGGKVEWNPDWSSFPSDHAVIFFAIATAVWLHNRWLGAVAYAWVLVFACLPRVYVGFHYPLDIAVGALVGIVVVVLACRAPLPSWVSASIEWMLQLERRWPSLFYPLSVLVTFETMNMFVDARLVLQALYRLL